MTFVVTTIAFRLPSCHEEIFQAHQHQATVSHSVHLLVHTPVSTDKQLCTTSASIALDTLAFKSAPCDGIAGVPCVVATCLSEVSLRFSMHKVMKWYTPWMSPYETTSPSKSLRIVHRLFPRRRVRTLGMRRPAYAGSSLLFHGCKFSSHGPDRQSNPQEAVLFCSSLVNSALVLSRHLLPDLRQSHLLHPQLLLLIADT